MHHALRGVGVSFVSLSFPELVLVFSFYPAAVALLLHANINVLIMPFRWKISVIDFFSTPNLLEPVF